MRVVQVNMFEVYGGAEKVARDLTEGCRARGHDAWLAVARKQSQDNPVYYVQYAHARICSIAREGRERGVITDDDASAEWSGKCNECFFVERFNDNHA